MNEHIVKHISSFLDTETLFHYLNCYYQHELSKTDYDEELCYKLECLYEWWEEEQRELPSRLQEEFLEYDIMMSIREQRESLFEQLFFH